MRTTHMRSIKANLSDKVWVGLLYKEMPSYILTSVIWNTFISKLSTDGKVIPIRNVNKIGNTFES